MIPYPGGAVRLSPGLSLSLPVHRNTAPLPPKGSGYYVNSFLSLSSARRSSRDTCTWDTPSTRAVFIWVSPL